MVERLNPNNQKLHPYLLDFISNIRDEDFYLTSENQRMYIEDFLSLKKLLKNSIDIFVLEEKGDYVAFCLIWKSKGGDTTRHYLKIVAKNRKAASDLLRGFLWNIYNIELFLKISKRHKFLDVFKKYGFKFLGGRGRQILLKRDKFLRPELPTYNKDAENEEE